MWVQVEDGQFELFPYKVSLLNKNYFSFKLKVLLETFTEYVICDNSFSILNLPQLFKLF
jgi:hypothetical protein